MVKQKTDTVDITNRTNCSLQLATSNKVFFTPQENGTVEVKTNGIKCYFFQVPFSS